MRYLTFLAISPFIMGQLYAADRLEMLSISDQTMAPFVSVQGSREHDSMWFPLQNDRPTTVSLSVAKTNCTCLTAQLSDEVLAPGGTALVRFERRVGHGPEPVITMRIDSEGSDTRRLLTVQVIDPATEDYYAGSVVEGITLQTRSLEIPAVEWTPVSACWLLDLAQEERGMPFTFSYDSSGSVTLRPSLNLTADCDLPLSTVLLPVKSDTPLLLRNNNQFALLGIRSPDESGVSKAQSVTTVVRFDRAALEQIGNVLSDRLKAAGIKLPREHTNISVLWTGEWEIPSAKGEGLNQWKRLRIDATLSVNIQEVEKNPEVRLELPGGLPDPMEVSVSAGLGPESLRLTSEPIAFSTSSAKLIEITRTSAASSFPKESTH